MPTAELTIESIAAGGDGVARDGALVVFVPRSAPGDRGVVRYTPGGSFARGELVSLREAAPERVEPRCPHYTRDRCGGCQIQHLAYDAQLAAKARIIRDAVQRIGRRDIPLPDVHPSPTAWRYRSKLTLGLRRRGGRWVAGLHPYDDPVGIFDLHDCPITDERVLAVWSSVMDAQGLFPPARRLRGAVRLVGQDGGALQASFTLEGGREWPRHESFFMQVPALASLWWAPEGGDRRQMASRSSAQAPGASFAQVNPATAGVLQQHLLDRVRAHRPAVVVDAYAGLGDSAVALARDGARVTAIELDPEAARWAASRLPAGSRALAGRVEELLPAVLPADVVIVNPPRAGVDARVAAALEQAAERPHALLYVSCNPATLARDLARLPGYRIASLAAFDMFPQTAHVETVCELVPERT